MIAVDSTSQKDEQGSVTLAHTCNGENRILFVYSHNNDGNTLLTCKYNNVAMTYIDKFTNDSGDYVYLYYLVNPDSGTHNITITTSGGGWIGCAAVSYTGAKQDVIEDSVKASASAKTITTTCTVSTTGAWLVGVYRNNSGIWTAGTNAYNRIYDAGNGGATMLADSNGTNTPGERSMTMNYPAATVPMSGIMCSFAPSIEPRTFFPLPSHKNV